MEELVSIIIPAHNEEKFIAKCLESIKKQSYKNIETIVVCNGCTDNTTAVARRFTENVFELRQANVSAARNFGAKKAKGNTFAFLILILL